MYVELHARSAFSFLAGASLPEEMAVTCAQLGMEGMAILDRDNLSGGVRFYLAAKNLGVKAHVGAEVIDVEGARYPLLVENSRGYQNLCRLISRMKLRAAKGEGAVTFEDLAEYSEGLVCLTGDEHGPLARALEKKRGGECLQRLIEIFGRRGVYLELQRHADRDQEARNQAVIELARSSALPLLATNGVCYAGRGSRELYDALTCIREKRRIDEAGRLLAKNSERFLKPHAEMARLFADLPEAVAHTAELAKRLTFSLTDVDYQFPTFPVPDGETMNSFLSKRAHEGARRRFRPYHARARQQIERELALIEKLDLAGYFLIVWELVEFCREHGILVQGRGSAANSAVCYALGITAVDPIAMDLLFERFLSEERGEWPDIDLDLPSGDERERVIQHVYERYGRRGAAMTANVITYRGRSAVRDLGKVLGFAEGELGRLSRLVGSWGWEDPGEDSKERFREAGFNPEEPLIAKFIELYTRIQDLPRHLGQHSGGMVICQGHLDAIVPLEPATMPGRVIVQWDKDDCASMGMIKVDLLGLGMMAVLRETLDLIRDHYHEEVSLAHLPPDDPLVYATLQKADTVGLFQVESRAQMSCLPRLRPATFYDIVVQVALIRPGPIVGQMMNPYLKRRQGLEPPECIHPLLEPVLERTLGVPLFQEQLLRIAMIAAGFTGGEAEELRRAFSSKRSKQRMRAVEEKLRRGMNLKGIDEQAQDKIVRAITSFALYGFPESHAASFALIAYASAYLKCHYLAAFTAGLLNNQPMGFYAPSTLVKDAQRHGLHFKPVDVARSDWLCTIEEHGGEKWVRLGLNYLRGVRESSGRAILNERRRAPFRSIQDLKKRVPELQKDELRTMSEAGALNFLQHEQRINRRDALWQAELAARPEGGPLLECAIEEEAASPLLPMSDHERLNADLHRTGVTIGRHPMAYHRDLMNQLGITPANRLDRLRNGQFVRVAGAVICRQRPGTAKGLVFLSLEDETGIANVVVMPDVFQRHRATIVENGYLLINGVLQKYDNAISTKAGHVQALDRIEAPISSHDFH